MTQVASIEGIEIPANFVGSRGVLKGEHTS